jgi:DNA-binding XRE family transcriptional regulator
MANKSANLIGRHVGNRLRVRRMMLAMSQTKLADALGITSHSGTAVRQGR